MTIIDPRKYFKSLDTDKVTEWAEGLAQAYNNSDHVCVERICLNKTNTFKESETKYIIILELSQSKKDFEYLNVVLNTWMFDDDSPIGNRDYKRFYKKVPPDQPAMEWYLILKMSDEFLEQFRAQYPIKSAYNKEVKWDLVDRLEDEGPTPWKKYSRNIMEKSELLLYPRNIRNKEETVVSDTASEKVFNCQPGTKWKDIKITLLSDKMVKIKTLNTEGKYTFSELKMSNKIKGDEPKIIWNLLVVFAKNQGFIDLHNITDEDTRKNLKKRMSLLNKHLQSIFGIRESINDGTYNKLKKVSDGYDNTGKEIFKYRRGYKAKIYFSDATTVIDDNDGDVDRHHKSLYEEELESSEKKVNLPERKKYQ